MKKNWNIQKIVVIGMLSAFIFISTRFLSIPLVTPAGKTMLKTANALALSFGTVFGGVSGGLACGIGSAIFDITDPVFAPMAWLTFIKFFLMSFICGKISHMKGSNGKNKKLNLTGAICGTMFMYFVFYCEKILLLMLGGSKFFPALMTVLTLIPSSLFNITFAIIVSQILNPVLSNALHSIGSYQNILKSK